MNGAYPVLVSSMNQDRPPTAQEFDVITARICREIGTSQDKVLINRPIVPSRTALAIASAVIGLGAVGGILPVS